MAPRGRMHRPHGVVCRFLWACMGQSSAPDHWLPSRPPHAAPPANQALEEDLDQLRSEAGASGAPSPGAAANTLRAATARAEAAEAEAARARGELAAREAELEAIRGEVDAARASIAYLQDTISCEASRAGGHGTAMPLLPSSQRTL
jgi:hypothetical protein